MDNMYCVYQIKLNPINIFDWWVVGIIYIGL